MGGGWIPACAGMTVGDSFANWALSRRTHNPHRHSGVGRNPEPRRMRRAGLAAYSVSPSPNPLPLGEGLRLAPRTGRAMSFRIATPAAIRSSDVILIVPTAIPAVPAVIPAVPAVIPAVPAVIPFPHHHSRSLPSFPFPTVIPAFAGIHTRPLFVGRIVPIASTGVLDSGLRRNDGGGRRGDGVGRGVGICRGSGFRPAPE